MYKALVEWKATNEKRANLKRTSTNGSTPDPFSRNASTWRSARRLHWSLRASRTRWSTAHWPHRDWPSGRLRRALDFWTTRSRAWRTLAARTPAPRRTHRRSRRSRRRCSAWAAWFSPRAARSCRWATRCCPRSSSDWHSGCWPSTPVPATDRASRSRRSAAAQPATRPLRPWRTAPRRTAPGPARCRHRASARPDKRRTRRSLPAGPASCAPSAWRTRPAAGCSSACPGSVNSKKTK